MSRIEVDAIGARATFERWLARGDAIGVFRNQDLSSSHPGHAVFTPLKPDEAVPEKIGVMHLRDGAYGPGWRYRLASYATTLDAFEFKEESDVDDPR